MQVFLVCVCRGAIHLIEEEVHHRTHYTPLRSVTASHDQVEVLLSHLPEQLTDTDQIYDVEVETQTTRTQRARHLRLDKSGGDYFSLILISTHHLNLFQIIPKLLPCHVCMSITLQLVIVMALRPCSQLSVDFVTDLPEKNGQNIVQ